jgi:glycine/D-amino acid oxidase-like deaminating enzyme
MSSTITRVAVLGAGTMGAGIAAHCANAGLQISLLDIAPESLTPAEALAASTDGQTTVAVGSRGDLVLLDDHPYGDRTDSAAVARHLCSLTVAATLVAGRPTHLAL